MLELEDLTVKQEYCVCTEGNICEFCFYGACTTCINDGRVNPYCKCPKYKVGKASILKENYKNTLTSWKKL